MSAVLLIRRPTPLASDTRADVTHLVRRAAFGAPAAEIDALAALGYEGAVDAVCDLTAPDPAADAVAAPTFDTAGYLAARDGDEAARKEAERIASLERRALPLWWVRRMVAAERPAREKLTLLWHDHFATSLEKVKVAELLYLQRQSLYDLAPGRFDDLVHAVARDPAMLVWLDGRENRVGAPNENFARELLELFTLGHGTGHAGHREQPYTEHDVADAARALTGWTIARTGQGVLAPRRHDKGTNRAARSPSTPPPPTIAARASRSTHPSPSARPCGTAAASRWCTAWASRASTAATSTAWTCGRPAGRTTRGLGGSVAGSTPRAQARSTRSQSAAPCPCWHGDVAVRRPWSRPVPSPFLATRHSAI